MELKELIVKIKNFQDIIIPESEYCWPLGDNYLFKETFYDLFTYSEKQDIAISTMRKQIDKELNIIDIELFELKITNPSQYNIICKELISDLLATLNFRYSKYYPLGWLEIEKHNHSNELVENNRTEVNVEDEIPKIEITTIPDKVRLLMELGIIDHLEKELPMLIGNKKKLTELLMQFLNIPYTSLQPVVNAIKNDDADIKKPKLTKKVQNVLNKYK